MSASRPGELVRRVGRSLCAATILLILGTPALAGCRSHGSAPSSSPTPPVPVNSLPTSPVDRAARPAMRDLIAHVRQSKAVAAAYVLVSLKRWPAGPSSRREEDVTYWRGQDRAGVVKRVLTSAAGAVSTATDTYPAPTMPLSFESLSAEEPILAGQMYSYAGDRRRSLLEVVAIMNTDYCLTSEQITNTLMVLANNDALRFIGTRTDRAGRVGVAFAMDSTNERGETVRDILIFDRDNGGKLLSSEQYPATADDRDGSQSTQLVLFLNCSNSETRPVL